MVAALGCAKWTRAQEASQDVDLRPATRILSDPPSAAKAQPFANSAESRREDSFEKHENIFQLETRFAKDQKDIWTSPARLRFSDAEWLAPLGGFGAGLFVTDRDSSLHLSHDPGRFHRYNTISNAGVMALAGAGGGLWFASHVTHNNHWRESGFLAGEAALNSLAVVEGLKYSVRRERPFQGDGSGAFFQNHGTSFPSEHAAAAWSIAGVLAHEYPGPLTKMLVYGLAAAVSYSRVRADKHFPSDVFFGAMIGDLISQRIYSDHHDPSLGGAVWESIREKFREHDESRSPANMGSPYVPLDSWIYPSLERLIALGYAHTAFVGIRPWTRLECARLVDEMAEQLEGSGGAPETENILQDLRTEFSPELTAPENHNVQARVESVYTRAEGISGVPLTDGYHFGQTLINDFGRPYAEGFNQISGFSAWGTAGPFVGYFRGEYQQAPALPSLPNLARQVIARVDDLPAPPALQRGSVQQFEMLDAYVAMNLNNWQLSFGRQSSWWGPASGGSMMFSDNVAPIDMFRIDRVSPFKLPSVLGWLGPTRVQFLLGQLSGHHFVFGEETGLLGRWNQFVSPQPFIEGGKISFKPTENLEFSVSLTTVLAGQGVPLTTHKFVQGLFSLATSNPGTSADPGDRRSGFDFTYRLPRLRKWLTFYADGYTDDEFNPIAYADRSAWTSGLYMPQIPGLRKMDFRVEGVYTDNPLGGNLGHGFYYFNDRYRNGYTNDGNLIGSWVGREGQGGQAWTNYWFGARNRVQLNGRHQKVSQEFIPGGGTLTDFGGRGDFWLGSSVSVSAVLQYEKWNFPVLDSQAQKNWTSSVTATFWPGGLRK